MKGNINKSSHNRNSVPTDLQRLDHVKEDTEKLGTGQSILRWAGSKRKLVVRLREYWSTEHKRYIEPFMGSAALFFTLEPTCALLSDINGDLVETFIALRDHPRAVHNRLTKLQIGEEAYYRIRLQDPSGLKPLDRATRFLYLNRFCFNGLYRTNKQGAFNVPFASSKTARLPSWIEMKKASNVLARASIEQQDFEETLEQVKKGDFVYIDPPYAVKNRRIFRQYGPDSFGKDDLARLAASLTQIDKCGATFVLSYAMCSEALVSFKNWRIRRVRIQRSVAGFSEHRRMAVELIVSNRSPESRGAGL